MLVSYIFFYSSTYKVLISFFIELKAFIVAYSNLSIIINNTYKNFYKVLYLILISLVIEYNVSSTKVSLNYYSNILISF